ncbi:hypothetical protein AB0O07_17880 [Streptomyces sp. NPDC093085]|uniref:hypothetical protein n=1 Tax=Streptomyces sp. NPDC093085 TaxID=3155068 RepID=UPI003443162D
MRHPLALTLRPTLPRLATAAALTALTLTALTGCTSGSTPDSASDSTSGAEAKAATTSPLPLPPPRSAPAPEATLAAPLKEGEVRIEEGPFTDRVSIKDLTLTADSTSGSSSSSGSGSGSTVGGHLTITSDVSDVLALELRAAYYDAKGRLVGTGTFQYQEEGEDSEGGHHHDGPRAAADGIDFKAPATTLTGTATSAVLSVPVLVNE